MDQNDAASRKTVKIGGVAVGDGHPAAIVAELGVNHLGDFGRAKEMIHAAHEAGADLIKFQTYVAEDRYDVTANPKGQAFIDMVRPWQFTRDQETALWDYAHGLGVPVFTSPFDADSVDFADSMGSLAFKVAAFEITNRALLRKIADKGKPVVFSCGMASLVDIRACTQLLDDHGVPYVILHTVSSYPLEKRHSQLRRIHALRQLFDCPIGHSDHTAGTAIPPLAIAAGANMIEKHFTTTPKLRQSDNFFSITPEELGEIVFAVRQVERWMGDGAFGMQETEEYMYAFRRHTE
ncbi:putative N-acetyl neuramic acid synthetase [Magnetospirillum gryphiswaldense MSR-1 v2]|uniref:N-acetyl neuramic acid synthetase n=1 Tax=Magnetospirillum gryphiswaldense (strain DSM 6361 / JCM 21280 / NBRC 15271 / MSR-1) TaxID=431944 RepID=V6F7S4_MAGGM|nr:N-acetylneuraminate synthase family protein [Magnetospirillum gryphiswaldense]CDL01407.1 putative N-acetyl neuramic acid synthetase [Magnetospirillum gryphiswaldense MSR-1 v2]